ncbi:hypothetical protein CEXT_370251 [Caerostris extrusa]|uniref:Uncharacterized protein n=1 Tax=Caerostris extrusa TaxID=172846 RepID=A0AAV4NEE2_CAEEX|nr:hypothetical protein CEXT_370251 [Caerostris extrusa]
MLILFGQPSKPLCPRKGEERNAPGGISALSGRCVECIFPGSVICSQQEISCKERRLHSSRGSLSTSLTRPSVFLLPTNVRIRMVDAVEMFFLHRRK